MVFCIKEYSSSLCLAYSTDQGVGDLHPDCFVLTESLYSIIYELANLYHEEFDILLAKIFDSNNLRSSEFHMKVILSSCVKLSSTPTFLNFLVVSSLISSTVFELFSTLQAKCFLFAKIASICLIAVYERCYKNIFKENEESESFESFCERIRPFSLSKRNTSLLPLISRQNINTLLASLPDVDVDNFELNNSEKKMLHDVIYSSLSEELRKDLAIAMSKSGEFESLDNDNDLEEQMNSLTLGENSNYLSRVNGICEFCDRKCYKFLISFESQVVKNDNLVVKIAK